MDVIFWLIVIGLVVWAIRTFGSKSSAADTRGRAMRPGRGSGDAGSARIAKPKGEERKAHLHEAKDWAKALVGSSESFVVVDTETTGLGEDDEIIEIAIVGGDRRVLLSSRIRPSGRTSIPRRATDVHGITMKDLESAPTLVQIYEQIVSALQGKTVVAWNSDFDVRLIAQSCARYRLKSERLPQKWQCAMKAYAQFRGNWNSHHGSYTYHQLRGGDHTAAGDALAVIGHLEVMADQRDAGSLGDHALTVKDTKRQAKAIRLFKNAERLLLKAEKTPDTDPDAVQVALDAAEEAVAALDEEDVADFVPSTAALETRLKSLEERLERLQRSASV